MPVWRSTRIDVDHTTLSRPYSHSVFSILAQAPLLTAQRSPALVARHANARDVQPRDPLLLHAIHDVDTGGVCTSQ